MPHLPQRLFCLLGLASVGLAATAQPVGFTPAPRASVTTGPTVVGARQPCIGGSAAGYACDAIDLMAFVPVADLGGATDNGAATTAELNDIWGWTDPETRNEYALVGRTDGTAFVDVTDPLNPAFLGLLPSAVTPGNRRSWRDVKVYADHAFVVSEENNHGMQVFDLTQLRGLEASASRRFVEDGHYSGISRAHNLVVDEETGFAYAVGSLRAASGPNCGYGLHIIDIRTPTAPTYAGCFTDPSTGRSGNGYTHDAQCVVYRGPDARYTGREVCFAANETALSIADVTDKAAPAKISALSYPGVSYTHQGWLSEDQRYFFMDDELDELNRVVPRTRTLVFDLLELDSPVLLGEHLGVAASIDHNQYIVERYSFQANYTSGLRVLDVSNPAALEEVAFFDTFPNSDATVFSGLWSVYPFFESRNVVASDIEQGLFVLRPTGLSFSTTVAPPESPDAALRLSAPSTVVAGPTALTLSLPAAGPVRVSVYDVTGRRVALLADAVLSAGAHAVAFDPGGLASGTYFVRAVAGRDQQTIALIVAR